MTIRLKQFQAASPECREASEWVPLLNEILPKHGVISKGDIALFLATTAHESQSYTRFLENLNYSEAGLLKTFPKYFKTPLAAAKVARQPQAIANIVYAGRLGNDFGNDGWFYRGIGLIHLTGKANHAEFGKTIGMGPEKTREYMQTKRGMIEAACWFWTSRNCSRYATSLDIVGVTKVVNGGSNGIADRKARLKRIIQAE